MKLDNKSGYMFFTRKDFNDKDIEINLYFGYLLEYYGVIKKIGYNSNAVNGWRYSVYVPNTKKTYLSCRFIVAGYGRPYSKKVRDLRKKSGLYDFNYCGKKFDDLPRNEKINVLEYFLTNWL